MPEMVTARPHDQASTGLPYEPLPAFGLPEETSIADCRGKRIGILVVTDNSLRTLAAVLKRIPPSVWRNVEEIVVFDDASQDFTFELAVGLKTACNLPKLQVIKNPKNLGYGGIQKAGYRYFLDKGFDVVILLHGDGQYPPEILARLYQPIVCGEADAVFGSRMMKKQGHPLQGGMPLYKYIGNRILTVFENRSLGMHLTEFHSGYRAYDLHALREIDFSQMTDDFHFDTEIIIKLNHQHRRIKEIPIPTYYGTELRYLKGIKYVRNVVRSVWRYQLTRRSVRQAREFAEYFIHYPLKEMKHSSHYYAQQFAGANHDVLDIGCGKGFFAAKLRRNGNRIVGVDSIPHSPEHETLEKYFQADLDREQDRIVGQLNGRRFDRTLLLDVLEHLVHPEGLLNAAQSTLKNNGCLVVSLPNVANITVRLMLLSGRFDYADRGIMDRTHLRFFTRVTARRLLEESGYEILEEKMTVMPIELILGLSPVNPITRALNRLLAASTALSPSLFGYQIMFLARSRPEK
jgi:2-polyprenyl-3-methyl-5-hydroxy-6-metoxy-1,4-benzoquinol methylase